VAETVLPDSPATPASKGLVGRIVGVLFSPRETYADIVRKPTWVGMWLLVTVVTTACIGWLQSTAVGRAAAADQAIKAIGVFAKNLPPDRLDLIREQIMTSPAWQNYLKIGAGSLIVGPIIALVMAGILLGVFNALMGGDAKFKQVFSLIYFSNAIMLVKTLFIAPLDYARESMTNPTTFAALLPMLDDESLPSKMLGAIDFFWLWWLVSVAIGLGVLYKRPTKGIATALIGIYVVLAVTIAAGIALIFG
jgi:Yip1 domain